MQVLRSVDTIAEFIQTKRAACDARVMRIGAVINALTVDVEEWFHICGVPALGPAAGTICLSGSSPRHAGCSIFSPGRRRARPFSCSAGWPSAILISLTRSVAPATTWDRTATGIAARTTRASRASPTISTGASRAVGRRRSVASPRIARRSGRSISAPCGRSRCSRAQGIRLDASMAPLRMVGLAQFPREPHVHQTSGGPILEVPPLVADRFGQAIPMGWGWGLRMSAPAAVLEGNRASKPGGCARRPDDTSVGNRSQSTSRAAAGRPALRPLLPSRRICRRLQGDPRGRVVRSAPRGGRAPGVTLRLGLPRVARARGVLCVAHGAHADEPRVPRVAFQSSSDRPLPADAADAARRAAGVPGGDPRAARSSRRSRPCGRRRRHRRLRGAPPEAVAGGSHAGHSARC